MAGPTIWRRRLGADLRQLRESRSLKLEDVADHLGVAASTLSRIETGKAATKTSYLAVLLDLYQVTDHSERRDLMDLARQGQRRGWWAEDRELLPEGFGGYLGLEAEASEVLAVCAETMPGLVQTADYARAAIGAARADLTADDVDRLVEVQMRRQQAPDDRQRSLRLILDESVLRRVLGSRPIMAGQLVRLRTAVGAGWLTVRVLPLAGGRPVLSPPFAILRFADAADPDVACAPGLPGQVVLEYRASRVRDLHAVFDRLTAASLAPAASLDLIDQLAGRYRSDPGPGGPGAPG